MSKFFKNYGKMIIIGLVAAILIGTLIDVFNPGYGWFATVPAGHRIR